MKPLDAIAAGVHPITVAPFTSSGELDAGFAGSTVLGIMGEASKLNAEDSRHFGLQVAASTVAYRWSKRQTRRLGILQ